MRRGIRPSKRQIGPGASAQAARAKRRRLQRGRAAIVADREGNQVQVESQAGLELPDSDADRPVTADAQRETAKIDLSGPSAAVVPFETPPESAKSDPSLDAERDQRGPVARPRIAGPARDGRRGGPAEGTGSVVVAGRRRRDGGFDGDRRWRRGRGRRRGRRGGGRARAAGRAVPAAARRSRPRASSVR